MLCFAIAVGGSDSCFVVNACERGDSLVWVGLERQQVSGLWESLRKRLGSRSCGHEVVNQRWGSGSFSVTLERGKSDPFFVVLCFAVAVGGSDSCFVVNACERGDSLVWVGLDWQGVSVVVEEASGREKKICESVQARPGGGGGGDCSLMQGLARWRRAFA